MSSFDDFTATVGVTLMESAGCLPWTATPPPALAGGRGWRARPGTDDGEALAYVLRVDGLDGEGWSAAIAAWRAWTEPLGPAEAVLLFVTEDAGDDAEPRGEWPDDPRWQPWLVDLAGRRIERPPGDAGGFAQAVDAAAMAYFAGPALKMSDLVEEERALLAGKAPFLAFLEAQPAPAAWVLLALILVMYLLATVLTVDPYMLARVSTPFQALTLFADALMNTSSIALLRLGATLRPLIEQGEIWRIVAANYLHAGLPHLLVNAYSLAAVGPTMEKIFGTPKFLAIWTVAGATGAAASAALNREATSVGASGALFGLLGAMLALGVRYRGAIPSHQIRAIRHVALVTLGVNLILGATIPNVDNVAHLGGLVGGLATAFVLGPHPVLIGAKPRFWNSTALWALPVLAGLALAAGLAGAAFGRMPAIPLAGPTNDYVLNMPIDAPVERVNQYLIVRSPRGEHFVLVHSVPNPEGQASPDGPAFTEATLDQRVYEVARRYASQGARLVDRPTIVRGGHHRFLVIPVAMPEGAREEIHVTASPRRIYAVRTRGLATDPWVRAMRDQVLATFRMREETN